MAERRVYKYEFKEFQDIENYWFTLQWVCCNTSYGEWPLWSIPSPLWSMLSPICQIPYKLSQSLIEYAESLIGYAKFHIEYAESLI